MDSQVENFRFHMPGRQTNAIVYRLGFFRVVAFAALDASRRFSKGFFGPVGYGLATTSGRYCDHRLSGDGGNSSDPHCRSSWVALALGGPPDDSLVGHRGMDPELVSLLGRWRSRHPRDPGSSQPSLIVGLRWTYPPVSRPVPGDFQTFAAASSRTPESLRAARSTTRTP